MERYLVKPVRADLAKKLVFLVGPRQVGKTTLAKALMADYPRVAVFPNPFSRRMRGMRIVGPGSTWRI